MTSFTWVQNLDSKNLEGNPLFSLRADEISLSHSSTDERIKKITVYPKGSLIFKTSENREACAILEGKIWPADLNPSAFRKHLKHDCYWHVTELSDTSLKISSFQRLCGGGASQSTPSTGSTYTQNKLFLSGSQPPKNPLTIPPSGPVAIFSSEEKKIFLSLPPKDQEFICTLPASVQLLFIKLNPKEFTQVKKYFIIAEEVDLKVRPRPPKIPCIIPSSVLNKVDAKTSSRNVKYGISDHCLPPEPNYSRYFVDYKGTIRDAAVHYAMIDNNVEAIHALKKVDAKISSKHVYNLCDHWIRGEADYGPSFAALLECGGSVTAILEEGKATPLVELARRSSYYWSNDNASRVFKALLDNGADPNAGVYGSITFLEYFTERDICRGGIRYVIDTLLRAGSRPTYQAIYNLMNGLSSIKKPSQSSSKLSPSIDEELYEQEKSSWLICIEALSKDIEKRPLRDKQREEIDLQKIALKLKELPPDVVARLVRCFKKFGFPIDYTPVLRALIVMGEPVFMTLLECEVDPTLLLINSLSCPRGIPGLEKCLQKGADALQGLAFAMRNTRYCSIEILQFLFVNAKKVVSQSPLGSQNSEVTRKISLLDIWEHPHTEVCLQMALEVGADVNAVDKEDGLTFLGKFCGKLIFNDSLKEGERKILELLLRHSADPFFLPTQTVLALPQDVREMLNTYFKQTALFQINVHLLAESASKKFDAFIVQKKKDTEKCGSSYNFIYHLVEESCLALLLANDAALQEIFLSLIASSLFTKVTDPYYLDPQTGRLNKDLIKVAVREEVDQLMIRKQAELKAILGSQNAQKVLKEKLEETEKAFSSKVQELAETKEQNELEFHQTVSYLQKQIQDLQGELAKERRKAEEASYAANVARNVAASATEGLRTVQSNLYMAGMY